jgi:hypothetical protein
MFSELEIMKTLRYLLIILGMASFLSVQAQGIAQMPTTPFRSTSTMVGSGSTLPVAANTGVQVTGTKVGTYADASYASQSSRPRRIGGNTSGGSEYREDPFVDPIGDAVLPLMLMLGAYGVLVYFRRKRIAKAKG